MSQGVLFAEDPPDMFFAVGRASVKLMLLHSGKFRNQLFVNNKILNAVFAGSFVLMCANPGLQELCHPKMWVSQ